MNTIWNILHRVWYGKIQRKTHTILHHLRRTGTIVSPCPHGAPETDTVPTTKILVAYRLTPYINGVIMYYTMPLAMTHQSRDCSPPYLTELTPFEWFRYHRFGWCSGEYGASQDGSPLKERFWHPLNRGPLTNKCHISPLLMVHMVSTMWINLLCLVRNIPCISAVHVSSCPLCQWF